MTKDEQLMTGSVVVGVVDTAGQRLVVRYAAEEAVRRGAVLRNFARGRMACAPGID